MALCLHNPASDAHIEELRDRLASQLGRAMTIDGEHGEDRDQLEMLVNVVRCMDKGTLSPKDAIETFTRHGFPGFSRWLVDMLDEGVYLDTRLQKAA